jgi:predicted ATPase/DNA-binding SARP family transcriptional activator
VNRDSLRITLLGGFSVAIDGVEVDDRAWRLRKARSLVKVAALAPGRRVHRDVVTELLWPDRDATAAANNLHQALHAARRALADPAALTLADDVLSLTPDAWVDVDAFEDAAARSDGLDDALGLYRGELLPEDRFEAWTQGRRAALRELHLDLTVRAAERHVAHGDPAAAIAVLARAAADAPRHEPVRRALMRALAGAGRRQDALAEFEELRASLREHNESDPDPETRALYRELLGDSQDAAPTAAHSGPRRRTALPALHTTFIGRERELDELHRLLDRARLVTLTGPGGAGKTRLAGEAVAAWADTVADGVWMVELAPVTAEVEVPAAVLGALGVHDPGLLERRRGQPPREGMDRLLDLLGEREAILLLDNCEHLVAAAAELADRLLAHCPRLRIVATSREPLAIAGEALAPVPPLPLPEPGATPEEALAHPAIELFADRAAAARPGFVVDEATVATVVDVCRRLDGLPLAIELAAARLRSMPLGTLAARLDDRFRLLTGGSRTALPRHRTLRAVVDWSWDLLEEPERRFARRLAVLGGGITEEPAAAVAGDPDALERLTVLADRSLLQPVPDAVPARYRMLETIREYGLEKLEEAGELETTRTAHARWFAALAARAEPELRGPRQHVWLRRLQADRDDLVSALRWLAESRDAAGAFALAADLLWFWLLSGAPAEARAWCELVAAAPGEADPHDRLLVEAWSPPRRLPTGATRAMDGSESSRAAWTRSATAARRCSPWAARSSRSSPASPRRASAGWPRRSSTPTRGSGRPRC